MVRQQSVGISSGLKVSALNLRCEWSGFKRWRGWERHFTITAPLSVHIYKRVPGNLMLGEPAMD